jgi:hypothetical protein
MTDLRDLEAADECAGDVRRIITRALAGKDGDGG